MKNGELMEKRETNWFRGAAAVMVVLSHYAEWWSWFVPLEGNVEMLRQGLAKLGVYGVDIFFLFSGYAMVKSLGRERMHGAFIWKRVKNVYIPYFIVVGTMELLAGGFASMKDFLYFASGYDHWYMFVLFVFYIGFIAVYTVVGGKTPRVVVFSVFTYLFSRILYQKGMQEFWYVSNIAFALGVAAGEYEEGIKKAVDKIWIPLVFVLAIGMAFVTKCGLETYVGGPGEHHLAFRIGATVVWVLLVLVLASKCRIREKVFTFFGRHSLYIYLTHTYIFVRYANRLELDIAWRFAASAVATVAVSFLCGIFVMGLERLVSGQIIFRK